MEEAQGGKVGFIPSPVGLSMPTAFWLSAT